MMNLVQLLTDQRGRLLRRNRQLDL